jgi:SAM-dependent methyltransferase
LRAAEISDAHVEEIARLGLGYWWYAVRLRQVAHALRGVTTAGPRRYLDFGCGTGALTERLIAAWRPLEALGLDGTAAALDVGAARGIPVRFADFRRPLALPFAPDLVTSLDVLEHLDDDVLALQNLASACAPGAALCVTVPASPQLFSRWDEISGHRRRYTRASLRALLLQGGWQPTRVRYFFSYCMPPAIVERLLLRRVREFEFPRVSPLTNRALILAGELERRLGNPMPFGTSLLAVATRAE